jgi:hypothetical protein
MFNEYVVPEPRGAVSGVVQKYIYLGQNSASLGSFWETMSSLFIINPTKLKEESLQSVRSTGHDIWSCDVNTHGSPTSSLSGQME